ncbi:hypothetical protein K1W69_06350 [Hoeflea sp. WL0058]|uniref:Uncharacterized protein n=1 Tax=Flavimaribacter sediminis TaxID=2865987 RepID=A0AAE3D0I9_9HYPH|nr:hypothetical protein [Flavimaribacter sediminis]MBW8636801.1 hypothetical protein [Flavimaribacter sediminis]
MSSSVFALYRKLDFPGFHPFRCKIGEFPKQSQTGELAAFPSIPETKPNQKETGFGKIPKQSQIVGIARISKV